MYKIFVGGKYPQGEFSNVDKLIEGIKQIPAIIYHTSHHLANGLLEADIPILGWFNNLKADNGDIMADFEFTDKGVEYKDTIKDISVEIDPKTNKLCKVGLLPKGIKPQIKGLASFEEQYINIEFALDMGINNAAKATLDELGGTIKQNINAIEGGNNQMTLEEILVALGTMSIGDKLEIVKSISSSITEADRKAAKTIAYEFAEVAGLEAKEKFEEEHIVTKTVEEIRAELVAEFEAKAAKDKELAEFEKALDKKVRPADRFAYLEAFKAAQATSEIIEFSETEKITNKEKLLKVLNALPDNALLAEFSTQRTEQVDEFTAAYNRTKEKNKK